MTYQSIRSRVEALPEPERSAHLALRSRSEWETSWELNAWDHQRPPLHNDWTAWTIIGPRRTGSTHAGLRWVEEKLFTDYKAKMLVMLRYPGMVDAVYGHFRQTIDSWGAGEGYRIRKSGDRAFFNLSNGLQTLEIMPERSDYEDKLRGRHFDFVWADEVEDAEKLMYNLRTTKQFVFSNPTKLPAETLLSRAGA